MSSTFYNKDPMAVVDNMDSYFKKIPPDCSLFSEDGFEIPVHKEVLYQTEFMRQMLKSANMDYCKIEIFCQTVLREELDVIVKFLYHGEICCTNHDVASQVSNNLNKLFGFPTKKFKFNGASLFKDELNDAHCQTVSTALKICHKKSEMCVSLQIFSHHML